MIRTLFAVSLATVTIIGCGRIDHDSYGYSVHRGDCDDRDSHIHPDAAELCDLVDNNCDGTVDESDQSAPTAFYADRDRDGWGDFSFVCLGTEASYNYVRVAGDCDDAAPAINPGQIERCNDGLDNNCDGTTSDCSIEGTHSLAEADFSLIGILVHSSTGRETEVADFDGDGLADIIASSLYPLTYMTSSGWTYLKYGPLEGKTFASESESWLQDSEPEQKLGYELSLARSDFNDEKRSSWRLQQG